MINGGKEPLRSKFGIAKQIRHLFCVRGTTRITLAILGAKMTMATRNRIAVIGGAAGVGKTSLLACLDSWVQFSTGTLFKKHMSLASRDEIRNGDWSLFEGEVASELRDEVLRTLTQDGQNVAIDTHFAAKIYGRSYRIGLSEVHLRDFGRAIFQWAAERGSPFRADVILVTTDPVALLQRRRLDRSRSRELLPSDCVLGLRRNDQYAFKYYQELAHSVPDGVLIQVKYQVLRNNAFGDTVRQFQTLFDSTMEG